MDDGRIHDRKEDVDGPSHRGSVHRDLHDNIHEEEDDGVVHQLEHDVDDMKEVYLEVVVVDEGEDALQEVVEDEELGELVGDEGHGDVVHLYDDEVVQEDASHGQREEVEERLGEELEDVQVEVRATGQPHVYVVDDAGENHDAQQVVDLLEVAMLILVLGVVAAPSDHDLEVFCEVVFLSFRFRFQNWYL